MEKNMKKDIAYMVMYTAIMIVAIVVSIRLDYCIFKEITVCNFIYSLLFGGWMIYLSPAWATIFLVCEWDKYLSERKS